MLMFLCICTNLNGKRALVAYKNKQTKSACFESCTFTRRTLLCQKDTSIWFKDTLKGNLRNMLTPYPWNSHAASKTRQGKTMTSFQSIDSFYFKITSLLDKATCQSHNW